VGLLESLAQWWSWGLMTPLIIAFDRRLPFSARQLPRRVAAHLVPSFVVTLAYFYVSVAMRVLFGLRPWSVLASQQYLAFGLHGLIQWSWLDYWLILGAWLVYQYRAQYLSTELRMERLERQFSEARLNALRMQLDPHFLFNALNTISSQVERDPKLARGMIGHLGDLLRLSLESKDRQEVPLAEELAFLDHYLAIQKTRFGENLKVEMRIAPEVKYALVPCLFVQPLVENAIRHGISRRASGGTVTVSARRNDRRLEVRVTDDGVGLPPGWRLETSSGVGLSVTRDRIASLHPDGESSFAVHRRESGGTEVEISLPFSLPGEDAHDSPAA
jgi:LytS/YehU family sensor histidine kinase